MNRYVTSSCRGGKSLIERVMSEPRIPMIKHPDGVPRTSTSALTSSAIRIADNAKTQRYATCNTMEALLVHEAIAARVLPPLAKIYVDKGVEMRCDEISLAVIGAATGAASGLVKAATEQDYYTEYLAPVLSVRIVASLDEAMAHIAKYGSQHTDAIITEDEARARRFLREVDSSRSW